MPDAGDVYVGAFISAEEAGIGGFRSKGDNRGFWQDPGDCSRSRACLSANLSAGVGRLIINYSCEAGGDCHSAWDLDGHANSISVDGSKEVSADGVVTTSLHIRVQATNSVTQTVAWWKIKSPLTVDFGVDVTTVDRPSASSIDYTTTVRFEAFPAYEIRAGGYEFTAEEAGEIAGIPFGLGVPNSVSINFSVLKLSGLPL